MRSPVWRLSFQIAYGSQSPNVTADFTSRIA
jgi:hypothetical protein